MLAAEGAGYLDISTTSKYLNIQATEPPAYIFWFHNKTMVNYSPDLGREVATHRDGMGSTLTVSAERFGDIKSS